MAAMENEIVKRPPESEGEGNDAQARDHNGAEYHTENESDGCHAITIQGSQR